MPQIGWFEILIIVVLAILIIGPKDFPLMLRKLGNWVSSIKMYFNEIQTDVTDMQKNIEEEVSIDKDITDTKNNKKNE
tara:strand:+ start:391 stop:624 length:234 start_codon:yes stop_codon:yes gene_type:complete